MDADMIGLDLLAIAILAGIGYFIGGVWLGISFGIVAVLLIWIANTTAHRYCDDDEQAEQQADTDGFAQRREPEDLGRWPFTREDKTP